MRDFTLVKIFSMPNNLWRHHHENCGTVFRGCDKEQCPAWVYDTTGKWIGPSRLSDFFDDIKRAIEELLG